MLRALGFILFAGLAVQAMDHIQKEPETLSEMRGRANKIIYDNIGSPKKQVEGVRLYLELIDKNDDFAAQQLAIHYQDGNIFPQLKENERLQETVKVLLSGAEKGNANAIFSLAILNKKNDFTLISVHKMMDYLKVGGEKNNDNCLCLLGQFYRDKSFCKEWDILDGPRLAALVFHQSTLNKSAVGAVSLAEMYLSTELGSPDFVQAYKYLYVHVENDNRCRVLWNEAKRKLSYGNFIELVEKQFDQEDEDANYYIAKGYLKGRYGLKVSIEKAESYLREGITKKSPVKSLYLLAKLYSDKTSPLYNYRMAGQVHNQLSKHRTYLAHYYCLKLTSPTKASFVLECMRYAYQHRDVYSNTYCGRFWSGTIKDIKDYGVNEKIANEYLKKALKHSYPPAYCFMAEVYTFGYHGEIDQKKAKEFLQQAVELKSYKAKVMLSNYDQLLENTTYQEFVINLKKKDISPFRKILLNYN